MCACTKSHAPVQLVWASACGIYVTLDHMMSEPEEHACWCMQAALGVAPGAHIHLKSTSEMLRLTVAYAAAASVVRALVEWRDLHAAGAGNTYKRQLAAADASSLHTLVDNLLGVPAQLQLDFGDHLCAPPLCPAARRMVSCMCPACAACSNTGCSAACWAHSSLPLCIPCRQQVGLLCLLLGMQKAPTGVYQA